MYKTESVDELFSVTSFHSAIPFQWDESFIFDGEDHDFWEIVFVTEGEVEVTEDEKVYRLQKNDLILHAPMEFHRIRSVAPSHPAGFITSFSTLGTPPAALREGCFALQAEEAEEYAALARRIFAFFKGHTDSPYAGQEAAAALSAFLIRLCDGERPLQHPENTKGAAEYRRAVSAMRERICDNCTLDELARDCSISVSYLKLLFKTYAGISPKSYYRKLRVQHAIAELRAGRTSAEIAAEMNFSSPAYFSNFFQKQTRRAPSSYRKMK